MPKSRPQFGLPQMQNRAKQTTAKGKQKGSNAVRRAVNRQIPALKRIANGSHTLRGAWEESGGDPLQWRVAHDKGETVYTEVCEIRQTGVVGLMFGQCDFIDGRVPDAIGDLRSSLQAISLEGCWSLSSLPDAFARLHLLEKCPKLSLPAAIDTVTGLALYYDLGGVVPPRTSSTSAFELAAASNRIRRRWASRCCFHCEKRVAETHPRFRCCGACRAAFYCSVDCQRKSWEADHRSSCSAHRRIRRRMCDVCGAFAGDDQPSFPVCGACGKRRYCGEACQIADWEAGHARKCG